MDKNIKKQWVEALRSKNYRKCSIFLQTIRGFSALGVLCDLYPGVEWHEDLGTPYYDVSHTLLVYRVGEHLEFPTMDIIEWANLPKEHMDNIKLLNDYGAPFARIADYIEEHL